MNKNLKLKNYINKQKDFNCFTLIAGKDITSTGNIIVAHNEEDPGFVLSYNGYVPPQDWSKNTKMPAEKDRAEIPQVNHTQGYYWTEFVTSECGLSSSDSYFNDSGVLVVSNGCNCSKEDLNDDSRLTDGGIEGNLRRVVAERAITAKHALNISIEMIEKYGYVPAGRVYTFVDKNEAYMIQIVSGKHYAAVKIPDNIVAVIPNHYTIHKLNEFDQIFIPKDFYSYAIKKGWYKPKDDTCIDFDFIKVYAEDKAMQKPYNMYRTKHAFSLLANKSYKVNAEGFPFGYYPKYKIKPSFLANVLSSHYKNTEDDKNLVGPGKSPHHSDIRRLCSDVTIHSLVCEFNDEPLLTRLWTCPSRPCSVPFLPHHPHAGIPISLNNMNNPLKTAQTHYLPQKEKMTYIQTNWQKFKDFANKLDLVFSDVFDDYSKFLNKINVDNVKTCQNAESMALELKQQGKIKQAKKLLCDSDEDCITNNLKDLEKYEQKFFNTITCTATPVSIGNSVNETTLTFNCKDIPLEDSLVFGISGTNITNAYSKCVKSSLNNINKNQYTVTFNIEHFFNEIRHKGKYACMFGGQTIRDKAFVSLVLLELI